MMREFLAPLGFGAVMVSLGAFQLARSQSGRFIWLRVVFCMAVGLFFIVFGFNAMAAAG
jgi:hypothetical protein